MSIARLMQAASSAGGSAPTFSYSYNDVLYIGPRFYGRNYTYITYAEFQNSGNELLIHNYAGEVVLNLSTAYDVSTGVSYKSGTATWVNADRYSNASYNAFNLYNAFSRVDTTTGKAYQYKGDMTTAVRSGLNSYTSTSLATDSSSANPFGGSISVYSGQANFYVKKSGGGVAIVNVNTGTDYIYLRNYANDTTATVDSYSSLSISSFDISSVFLLAMSADGTKLSIYYRNSVTTSRYDVQTWTLSTAFDLSTAGTPTETQNVGSGLIVQNCRGVRDPSHNRLLYWDLYGGVGVFSWTTDGDISTFTKTSTGNRSQLGFYRSCCSSMAYFDEGNYVINYGYSGSSTYVFGPLSTPYDWQWEDGGFTPRSGTSIRWGYNSDTGSVPPQDGQMDAGRNYLYAGFYSSTYRVYKQNFTTAGDPTTITLTGYEYLDFTGWVGYYSNFSMWVDRNANKLHMADGSNPSGTYFIFDLDADGGFSGTYSTTPSGFTAGDFYQKSHIQPLSSDGTIFIYYQSSLIYVVELNTAYNPAQGWTVLGSFSPHYTLPNGSTRAISSPDVYVQDHIIFAVENRGNKTARIDVLIDGLPVT